MRCKIDSDCEEVFCNQEKHVEKGQTEAVGKTFLKSECKQINK
jgi:hypothetical protein